MLTTDPALMRAEEPALEKRRDPMNARQYGVGRLATPQNDSAVVAIATLRQAAVALQPVGDHDRSRLDGGLHERHQAVGRGIRHPLHPDAPDGTAAYLSGNDHQGLLAEVPASAARLDPADDGLVHLDLRRHPVPTGPHHRAAELVQPRPGRAVAAQAEDALQAQGAGAVLLAHHPPDRPEPQRQRGPGALEDRPRHHRRLVPTGCAHPSRHSPR